MEVDEVTSRQVTDQATISEHPDLVAMQERYARAFDTPVAWASEGLMFLAGAYAAISPWVVGFNNSSGGLAVSNLIVGLALAVLTLGFATSSLHVHGMAWVAPLMGVWLIVSPWAVQSTHHTAGVIVSNVIVGGCVVLIGAAMTSVSMRGARR